MSRHLLEPITEGGIRNANFFNGRLLTAQDLDAMQESNRDQHRQLGAGLGDGVVYGLEVELASSSTQARPVLRVSAGLAFNRRGEAVALSTPNVEVELTREAETFAPEAGLFGECSPASAGDDLSNVGVYVLVASPASAFEGFAPTRHSISSDAVDRCGRRYTVEGIKFRREHVDLSTLGGVSTATRALITSLLQQTDMASLSKLRNVLAHLCFDTEEPAGQRRDPFKRINEDAGHVNYGALSALRKLSQLTDCDVPLALVYWSRQGVQFVDNWAVRRLARRYLDLDVLSVLRGYGYERLLQFERQLEDIFGSPGGIAALRVQDYFRFVPPVGYFPVTGGGSPRGFHPVNFFRQFTTGQPGQMTVERFGALLRESFACPDQDLQAGPVFEIYGVRDNAQAVVVGDSSQLYLVFVSRALDGPLAQDGVARAFSDAWEVYRSLIKRRIFLPAGFDEEKAAAQADITFAVRNVLDMSNRMAALAASRSLDTAAALGAFQEMYRVQKELTTLFRSVIPGIIHTQGRESFGEVIDRFLDNTLIDGSGGLLPSIHGGDLIGVVKAQNQINTYVGTYTGQGAARGPFGFRYLDSPRGLSIVPGATRTALPQNFAVLNHTDQRLTIDLEGSVTAGAGNWDNSVKIHDPNGQEITEITLNSGTEGNITVLVTAPNDAHVSDTAILSLAATVPPPTDRTVRTTLSLNVANQESPPVTTRVAFDGDVTRTVQDPNNAPAGDFISYFFNLVYSTQDGPPSADFEFSVNLVSSPAAGWSVEFQGVAARHNSATTIWSRDLTLSTTGPNSVEIIIDTPQRGTVDRSATFTVSVRSKTQPNEVNAQHPDSFSLTVKAQ